MRDTGKMRRRKKRTIELETCFMMFFKLLWWFEEWQLRCQKSKLCIFHPTPLWLFTIFRSENSPLRTPFKKKKKHVLVGQTPWNCQKRISGWLDQSLKKWPDYNLTENNGQRAERCFCPRYPALEGSSGQVCSVIYLSKKLDALLFTINPLQIYSLLPFTRRQSKCVN